MFLIMEVVLLLQPQPGRFGYSQQDFVRALDQFIVALGIRKPFSLVVHGFVLSQYGLLYALQHADSIDRCRKAGRRCSTLWDFPLL